MTATSSHLRQTLHVPDQSRKSIGWIVGIVIACVTLGLLLASGSTGVDAEWLRNPSPQGTYFYGGVPRANLPLWGIQNWPRVWEIVTVIATAACCAGFGFASWRQRRVHPGIFVMIASVGMIVFDPLMDWVTFAVFDPRLLHLPASWPYVRLVPGFEPLFVLVGWPLYLVVPGALGAWLYNRVRPRFDPLGWFARHQVVSAFLVALPVLVIFDIAVELAMAATDLWTQTQLPGPVVYVRHEQWAILWEPLLLCPVLAVSAVLLSRGADGTTLLDSTVARYSRLASRPALGRLVIAWSAIAIMLVGYYQGGMALIRMTGHADHINLPYPYQDMKVYDPQGLYQKAGIPGPYYQGAWPGRW